LSKRKRIAVYFIAALSVVALCGVCCAQSKPPPKSSLKIDMISIPASSFMMGNSGVGDDKKHANPNELPQHSVTLTAYSIGKYEVTRGQYRQFINAGGYTNSAYWSTAGWSWKGSRTEPAFWAAEQTWGKTTFTQTDNHPVVGVTYYEAEAFCKWAGGHLPTEAQWERAARWNSKTKHANVYPWGDTWDAEKCNNFEDHKSAGGGYLKCQTAPVGSYPSGASPSGCQDMAGNVREWCKDWYGDNYYISPSSDPQGPASGSYRVLRGGSWSSYDNYYSRCAYRGLSYPYYYNNYVGFRLAR
jgi:formylglycine-generating enzyme required for sulfatase activity